MCEILFRGKDILTGEWLYGDLIQSANEEDVKFIVPFAETNTRGIISETIGQFTGLCDKNGKKIFEGDIVIYNDNENADSEGEFSIVVWYDDDVIGFALEHHSPSCEVYYECEWVQSCCYYEIIGNVFDNPELLKGDDKTK